MNRQIKFRGKRIDTGEWVIGSLSIEFDNTHRISLWVNTLIEPENNYWESVNEIYEVMPETVGQYLGFKDNEGKEVYKGDYISEDDSAPYEVLWQKHSLGWIMQSVREGRTYRDMTLRYQHLYKVIGNIHDNPELLNPPADSPALNTMNNFDPGTKQAEEAQDDLKAAPAEQATEESAEEGNTEG